MPINGFDPLRSLGDEVSGGSVSPFNQILFFLDPDGEKAKQTIKYQVAG